MFQDSVLRIVTAQILRANGIDRAKPLVVESLNEIFIRIITALGQQSRSAAECAGRSSCDLEDVRHAMETLGIIQTSDNDDGVIEFVQYCMSDTSKEIRRIAGEGNDEMGETVSADWLKSKSLMVSLT